MSVASKLCAYVAVLAIAVLSGRSGLAETVRITDATGREVTVTDASRVLAIGGSITEILYALGLEQNIAAVDTTSVYPPEALATKPNVGYMRALSAEGVLSLNPSLILSLEGAGPPNVIEVLRKADVPFVSVRDEPTAEGIIHKIRFISEVMNAQDRGERLAASVSARLAELDKAVSGVSERKSVLFILSVTDGRLLVAGRDTEAEGILSLAAADNAMTEIQGYKPVSREAVVLAAPDALLMMSHMAKQYPPDEVFAIDAVANTPAGRSRSLIVMGGQYLLGFGPRTPSAAWDLAAGLYKDALPEPPEFAGQQDE